MSVTKRVDSNLFKFLMAHVDKHILGDLGNKTHWLSETKANACDTNCTRHFLRVIQVGSLCFEVTNNLGSTWGEPARSRHDYQETGRSAHELCYQLSSCWFGSVGCPGESDYLVRLSSKHKVNFCWMKTWYYREIFFITNNFLLFIFHMPRSRQSF